MPDEHFGADVDDLDWEPRWNIAPTLPVPVIPRHPKESVRELSLMRCALIPLWATNPAIGARTINARSETARQQAVISGAGAETTLSGSSVLGPPLSLPKMFLGRNKLPRESPNEHCSRSHNAAQMEPPIC